MSSLYDKLQEDKKIFENKTQNKCDEICIDIENKIKEENLNGFNNYTYVFKNKLQYDRFSCGIVEYFKNKGIYCRKDCENYENYIPIRYYIEFKWDKTLEEYMIIEKIKNISSVIVLFGIIFGIILMFAFN